MREKELVDTVQKEYDDFKAHINTHAISSWRGLRASHKIVLGEC